MPGLSSVFEVPALVFSLEARRARGVLTTSRSSKGKIIFVVPFLYNKDSTRRTFPDLLDINTGAKVMIVGIQQMCVMKLREEREPFPILVRG